MPGGRMHCPLGQYTLFGRENYRTLAERKLLDHYTGVTWPTPPTVLYRHMVKPKPNATILLPGDHAEPLLVGTTHGQGRVVVFTGTVLGLPPEAQPAFWDTAAWKAILSRAVTWAAGR